MNAMNTMNAIKFYLRETQVRHVHTTRDPRAPARVRRVQTYDRLKHATGLTVRLMLIVRGDQASSSRRLLLEAVAALRLSVAAVDEFALALALAADCEFRAVAASDFIEVFRAETVR
jgi:hypothetical protein